MTQHAVTIRNAAHSDIDVLVNLLGELFAIEADFSFDPDRQRKGLRLLLDGCLKHRCFQVAEVAFPGDGSTREIVGMCSAQALISTAEGGMAALVEDLVVKSGWRGKGIGPMLLSSIEKWCADRAIRRIQLLADAGNKPALAFYNQMAWRSTRLICLRKRVDAP